MYKLWKKKPFNSSTQQKKPVQKKGFKRNSLKPVDGVIHVLASLNNTILTLTDTHGNAKAFSSAGSGGLKGSKKSTNYASQMAGEKLGKQCMMLGYAWVNVHIKGIGYGKQAALRGLSKSGIKVQLLKDVTPFPHNGCRPPKKRRV